MRKLFRSALWCLGLLAVACGGGVAPTPVAPAPPPPVTFAEPYTFAEPFTQITVGEVVKGRVSATDPLCVEEPMWPCQHFRITPPADGRLDVVMTYTKGNLDVSFRDAEGRRWWPVDFGSVPVKAGRTYEITIWEYEYPGVEFELRTSLQAN